MSQITPLGTRSQAPRMFTYPVNFNNASSADLFPQPEFTASGFVPQFCVVDATACAGPVTLKIGPTASVVPAGCTAGFPVLANSGDAYNVSSPVGGTCVVRFSNSPAAAFLLSPAPALESGGNLQKISGQLPTATVGDALAVSSARAPVRWESLAVTTSAQQLALSATTYYIAIYSRGQPSRVTFGPAGTAAPTAAAGIYVPANTLLQFQAGPNYLFNYIQASDATAAPTLEITET